MLRAANQVIDSALGFNAVYRASDWELFRTRPNGNFASPTKLLHINTQAIESSVQLIHDVQHEVILAPGDNVYSSLDSSSFTLHYTSSMIWPNEIVGGRKMPSRATLYSLTLNESRNVAESKNEWYEVTFLSPVGASAYRISVGDSRGQQFAEPPAGRQWRIMIGPGDYVSLIGGGTVSVGVTVTELPPVDRLVKQLMEKLRQL